jgi:hypothetical protein
MIHPPFSAITEQNIQFMLPLLQYKDVLLYAIMLPDRLEERYSGET